MLKCDVELPYEYLPYEDHQILSITEIAKQLKMEYIEAQGFIKFGIAQGFITLCGTRKAAGQKGKPTNLYKVPNVIHMTFYDSIAEAA